MKKQYRKMILLVGIVIALFSQVGLAANLETSADTNRKSYAVSSKKARDLIRGDSIQKREKNIDLPKDASQLPRIIFRTQSDENVKEIVRQGSAKMLGSEIKAADIQDNGNIFSIAINGGIAWSKKLTGGLTVKIHDYQKKVSRIQDTAEAVDIALAEIANTELLELSKNESLEVLFVTATYYAGWYDNNGTLEPVYFYEGDSKTPLENYKSEYTVHFGRRYRGVPIIGSILSVRLSADGEMVSFMKSWRDIEGEDKTPIDIATSDDIAARKNASYKETLSLVSKQCGYTEDYSNLQTSPGVGCVYTYDNPSGYGQMNDELVDSVNIERTQSLSLYGTERPAVSKKTTGDLGEDISE